MELLNKSLQSQNTPNLLLYGYDLITSKENFHKTLNELYTIDEPEILKYKTINYTKTNIYYEFNMKLVDVDNFSHIVNEIIQSKNFFGILSHKLIILTNFIDIKYTIQNILRVLIEKYRESTVFIIITNKYHSVIEPLRSRCLQIRFPLLTRREIRKYIYQSMDLNDLTREKFDIIYKYQTENILKECLDLNLSSLAIQLPEEIMCDEIISIYRDNKYNKDIHARIRNISYNILKYGLNIREFLNILLDKILKEKILDKCKIRMIHLLSELEYNFKNSYRKNIIMESLLVNLFRLYNLERVDVVGE